VSGAVENGQHGCTYGINKVVISFLLGGIKHIHRRIDVWYLIIDGNE